MIRTVLSALAALALLGAPALAQSAPPPPAAAPQPAAAPGRAPLSPQVRQTVRDTRQRFAPQVRPIRQDMRDARQALRAELAKPQPSDATLRQLEDRLVADRQRLQAIHAQADADLRRGEAGAVRGVHRVEQVGDQGRYFRRPRIGHRF